MNWSALQKFYLDNWRDIDAIEQLKLRAREEIPSKVRAGLSSAIAGNISENGWKGFSSPIVKSDEEGVWWADERFYNEPKSHGLYYAVYDLNTDSLLSSPQDERDIYLVLSYSAKKRGKHEQRDQARLLVDRRKPELDALKVRYGLPEYLRGWDECLACIPVDHVFTVETLSTWSDVAHTLCLLARKFSELTAAELPDRTA